MSNVSIPAHFDGERILLDEPIELEPNTKLIVTVLGNTTPIMTHGCVYLNRVSQMLTVLTRRSTR